MTVAACTVSWTRMLWYVLKLQSQLALTQIKTVGKSFECFCAYTEAYYIQSLWKLQIISYSVVNSTCGVLSLLFHSFLHQWLYSPFLGPGLFFSCVIFFTKTVGLFGKGISPSQGRYLHTGQHKHRLNSYTDIHVLSGIRTHDHSMRASEDSSCLRSRGHCDRIFNQLLALIFPLYISVHSFQVVNLRHVCQGVRYVRSRTL
jgi:hypothetical protein